MVSLERCHDRPDCKSELEINEFLRGKYVVILHNRRVWNSDEFEEASIVNESKNFWLPIST